MEVVLTISSYHNSTPGQVTSARIGNGDFTIGRGSDCDWVLIDTERLVSSKHVRVYCDDDQCVLVDTSTNGTFLNDEYDPVEQNTPVALNEGDQVKVGDFVLDVRLEQGSLSANDVGGIASFAPPPPSASFASEVPTPLNKKAEAPPVDLSANDITPSFFDEDSEANSDKKITFGDDLNPFSSSNLQTSPPPAEPSSSFREPEPIRPVQSQYAEDAPVKSVPDFGFLKDAFDLGGKPKQSEVAQTPPPSSSYSSSRSSNVNGAAFVQGLGLSEQYAEHFSSEEAMHGLGRIMRGVFDGLLDVQALQYQLRSEAAGDENLAENDASSVARRGSQALLEYVLQQDDAQASVTQLIRSMMVHEVALIDAMQQGAMRILNDLSPEQFIKSGGSDFAALVGGSKAKANAWDDYSDAHERLQASSESLLAECFVECHKNVSSGS